MNKLAAVLALGTAGAENFVQGGTLSLNWKDCGDAATKGKVTGLTPTSLTLGQKTRATGVGSVTEDVSTGKIAISLKASIISKTYSGDVCAAQTFTLPLGVGSITYDGVKCPVAAGTVSVPVDILLSSALPSSLATADITISATSTTGDKLLCMDITTAPSATEVQTQWESFKAAFAKTYTDDAEELMRFGVFQKNVEHIDAENAKGNSYTLAINQFSDLTSAELSGKYMGFNMPSDASQLYGGAAFLGNHTWQGEDLPAIVDWTTQGAVTPVKDQGQCGSCWVFSATGAMEGAYQIARKSLVSLAEQQFVDCDHGILPPTLGCNGGSMSAAFGFAKSNALCTETSYKYQAKNGECQKSCTVAMPEGTISGYKGLALIGKLIPASYNDMMSAVAQQPVSVSIEADKDVFHHYSSGVVEGACGQMPDHGVLVVGYGTDPKLGDYWKVKNSWGTTWGEKGYVRVKRGGSWRGECAILNSPSYPVISSSLAEVVV